MGDAIEKIDWSDETTRELKQFLEGHVAAMAHCDEEPDDLGLCECVHRLADWWAEQYLLMRGKDERIEQLERQLKEMTGQ